MTARFSGPQGKNALTRHRDTLRREAEERNEQTAPENRKAARLGVLKATIHRGGRTIAVRGALPVKEDTA